MKRDWLEFTVHFVITAIVTAIVGAVIVISIPDFEFSIGTSLIIAAVSLLIGIVGAFMGDDFWHASWNPLQWLHWWK